MIQIKPNSSAVRLESSTKDWAVWREAHQLTCSGKPTQTNSHCSDFKLWLFRIRSHEPDRPEIKFNKLR